MKKASFWFIGLSLLVFSCRKSLEKPSWDVDLIGPIVYSSLGLEDMIPDSLLQVNPDSSVTLVFNSTIYELSLDTLVVIPDTTVNEIFKLPAFAPPVNVNPGQQLFTQTDESSFNVSDVELTDAILLEGSCEVVLSSTINQPTDFTYSIPYATLNGIPFLQTITIPAGSIATPSSVTATFDLSGYELDLRGINHPYNSYTTIMTVTMSANGLPTVVTNTDIVNVQAGFYGLRPSFAKGYFGNRVISSPGESTYFDLFDKIVAGTLDIDQVNVDLKLTNWIGIDAGTVISLIEASNTSLGTAQTLNNSLIGNTIHLNRAINTGYTSNPTNYTVSLDEINSNIDDLLELLADEFTFAFDMEINPLGDISGHNDFIYHDKTFKADLNITLPLNLIANGLTLADTLDIALDKGENGYVTEGVFQVDVKNGFPLDGNLQLYFFDQNGNPVDSIVSSGTIPTAVTNISNIVTAPSNSMVEFRLNQSQMERLYNHERMILKVIFNTSSLTQHVSIYSHYKIDLKIRGDFNYHIEFNE